MIVWLPETFDFVIKSNNEVRIAFLWLALFPTTIGYLTWTYTVGHYGANKASLFLYLIPPISILLDLFWYGNGPSFYTTIGGLIIILSVSLTLFYKKNNNKI